MVNAQSFADSLNLTLLSPSSIQEWDIKQAQLNRPGLELVGYYEYFAYERPQIFGKVEMSYLDSLSSEKRREAIGRLFSYPIPCVVLCRGLTPHEDFLSLARERDIPVYLSQQATTQFIMTAILYLNSVLAARTTMHAVLVDVYGVGVLISGESGVGKSESALELVKRGHMLVADDVVDIKRVSDTTLLGESPETIRHFMELRGIGLIDIRQMFGIGSVLPTKSINMQIHLENWKESKEYDRLGMDETYTSILGVRIPHLVIPVRPGRNLSIIIEVAARNYSLKRLGFSAAKEMDRRLNEMMGR